MAVSKPLLLLDNASMLALLHQGCFRLQEISFEEVKAIIEMHGSREVVRCFSNAEIEQLLYKHLDVAIRNFNYAPVDSHVQKGIDMAKYIENKILTQDLSPSDRALAIQLLEDLYSALGR